MSQKILNSHADILGNLAQKYWRDVFAGMIRDRGAASLRVTILHVRATLADEHKTERLQKCGRPRAA